MVLLQEAVWSVMFWSYVPLIALGIIAAAFAVKMPIEVLTLRVPHLVYFH